VIKQGTDHYLDDILVHQSLVEVVMKQLLLRYGLVTQELETP